MLHYIDDIPLGIRSRPTKSRRRPARLISGYSFEPLEHSASAYRFTIMAGASKVPGLFRAFAATCPESFLILEFYEEDACEVDGQPVPTVYYSSLLPTDEILATIEPYLPRLIHDGFVGFGLANNRLGFELFYSEEKIVSGFTGNHLRFTDTLARLGLEYNPTLTYPAAFHHDHLSLLCHPRQALPEPFASMSDAELDYGCFCGAIVEELDMYPVEESLSFFFSEKEQDQIEERLLQHPEFADFAEEDFGALILDWNDFVDECEQGFEGDLWEYNQGLQMRDMIQYIVEGLPQPLSDKIHDIIGDADTRFQQNLIDRRKRLDEPGDIPIRGERFWYQGVVRNQGVDLRRDLIRQGWFKS